ncbi:MAG: NADH-quinone oxidoreductase subunit I [Nitriliruptor sp.]|nr:MAG: NADH-quinone oxidoreductase subunit I [Nitriliruptor sp.]
MATTSAPGVGLLKGLGVTIKHLFKQPATQMYPKQRPDLAPRTRGVIALMDENCTVCMLCSRECPDWCIYIESHKETVPPAKEGGRARTRNVLDRFAIDFSLCMYCGICVEVCPFDALWWSPEFEYAEYDMGKLLHEKEKLREWMDTVPAPPMLEEGAVAPAEVTDAIAKKEKELEAEAEKQREASAAAEAPKSKAVESGGGAPKKADVEVKGAGEIDQETFDKLIAEGKSERIARSKAKAAWVRKEKERLRAEQESAEGGAEGEGAGEEAAAKPKAAQVEVEAGQIDQETYDKLIGEGKSERMARAKAKAAYVRKERARLTAEQETASAEPATDDAQADDAGAVEGADAEPAPAQKVADVHVEGTGEIDQETFDRLIAEGKSERIARSKAKAAWVRKEKQRIIDEGGDA